jgi:serine/threonine-protein kinase
LGFSLRVYALQWLGDMDAIGRYQILGELGRGAMGVVYRAQDPAIGRTLAIKTIRLADLSDHAERARLQERLFREAQSAGILSHPGIVVVYDVGTDGDVTYIAMEFVNGPTLEKLLADPQPPGQQTVLGVLRQTAAALDYAHKKGIIHRDIKPANIMIDGEVTVKITDFGIAKIVSSQQMTQTGLVMGTPNYMSPEQIQGKPVDGKADQFALAVVAYEMLTGEKPFTGEQLTTVLYKIVSEDPPPVEHLNPTLGFAVSMVLTRAMSKDPAKRYGNCSEFVDALEAALNSKKGWQALARGAGQSMPTEVVAGGVLAARPQAYTEPEPPKPSGAGRAMRWIAGLVLGIGVVALLFLGVQKWLLNEPAQREPAAAVTPPAPSPGLAKPSPATRPVEAPVSPRVPSAAEAPTQAPRIKPAVSSPASPATVQIVTSPPGAQATLDHDPSKTCTAPCSFGVAAGRHTLTLALAGYRQELRLLDVNGPREIFVNLTQPTGTVRVETDPPGADVLVDDQPRSEKTPATFVLPVGSHTLAVVKEGHRTEQRVQVRDGALVTFNLQLNP